MEFIAFLFDHIGALLVVVVIQLWDIKLTVAGLSVDMIKVGKNIVSVEKDYGAIDARVKILELRI